MDWENRKITLPQNTPDSYFYIAIYIDRNYINNKVVEITKADKNRVMMSINKFDVEREIESQSIYNYNPIIQKNKFPSAVIKKKIKGKD